MIYYIVYFCHKYNFQSFSIKAAFDVHNMITLFYHMLGVGRNWISGQIIYPTKAFYLVEWGIKGRNLGREIILSCLDMIK